MLPEFRPDADGRLDTHAQALREQLEVVSAQVDEARRALEAAAAVLSSDNASPRTSLKAELRRGREQWRRLLSELPPVPVSAAGL